MDYAARFSEGAEAFAGFLDRLIPAASGDRQPAGVVVVPWVATPLPWFGVALAYALRRRGRPVVLIWDDTDHEHPFVPTFREQNQVMAPIIERVGREIPVVRLSTLDATPGQPGDEAVINRLVLLNEHWDLRGGPPSPEALQRRIGLTRNFLHTLGKVRTVLHELKLEYLLVGGGVWGSSGLFVLAGSETGTRVSTYDAGLGWVVSSNQGAAAHQSDVSDAFRILWKAGARDLEPLLSAGKEEYATRLRSRDRTEFQVVEAGDRGGDMAVDVLIAMNVDHDTAALGRHAHFVDTTEWISETVEFVLQQTSASVVVRQHPSERRDRERSRLDIEAQLLQRFGSHPRLRFVRAEDPVSTYDLLARARVVLPFVSTIGIEGAALGKPVIPAGAAYYDDLGFVHVARSKDEYFDLLTRALDGALPVLDDQVERAWLCYYLSQICNRVWTEFTPQPDDFWAWSARDPEDVYDDEAVQDLLTSIDEDEPLAIVRHRRLAAGSSARIARP